MGKPVYFDTGVVLDTMTEEQFLRIARNHGADKILFATDSPWADQTEFIRLLKQMPLTEEEKEQILGGNARRLLGI